MSAIKEHEAHVKDRLGRAHEYHNDLNDGLAKDIDDLSVRVDRIESALDQMRGAKNLLYFVGVGNVIILASILYDTFIQH